MGTLYSVQFDWLLRVAIKTLPNLQEDAILSLYQKANTAQSKPSW
jgi:hypothetical protein